MFAVRARQIQEITLKDRLSAQIPEIENIRMKAGEIVLIHFTDEKRDGLFICCPNCGQSSHTGKKHVVENKNGIINVDPSLIFHCCGWHGWLLDGYFKEHQ